MEIKLYQVDAFTDKIFSGNPAAVCPLGDRWLDDALMQNIAMENNLSETAFYIRTPDGIHIRWFTPRTEVELCGHATLASAFVIFYHEHFLGDCITFESKSGSLHVKKTGDLLAMDFPADGWRFPGKQGFI